MVKNYDDTAWLRPVPLCALYGIELKLACEKTRRWWGVKVEEGKWRMGSFFARADFSLFPHQRGRSLVVPGYKLSWSNGAALSCQTPTNKLKLTIVISSLLFVWFLLLRTQKRKKSDNIAIQLLCHHMWALNLIFLKYYSVQKSLLGALFSCRKSSCRVRDFLLMHENMKTSYTSL